MLDPAGLYGMQTAVRTVVEALKEGLTIALAGDYDVDGATGVALGMEALTLFGAKKVVPQLPDRFVDGYGLSEAMVEEARNQGVDLLITVDNGIAAHQAINLAHENGMQVIITDHHLPGGKLPPADAIINPNMPECAFGSKNLTGAGVIFYLMCAVRTTLREQNWFLFNKIPEPPMSRMLDLVALGAIADMANIDRNNRLLIKSGVARIRAGNAHKGIIALLEAMQVNPKHCAPRDLGFSVAPPLNAAGRLAHMDSALACLLAASWAEARNHAAELVAHNTQRKQIQNLMYQEALAAANAEPPEAHALVLYNPDWHQGLTGLVAGMIKDKLGKSCFVLTRGGDLLVGSARSAGGDHLLDWLETINTHNQELLARFGGHAAAVGFTLYPHALDDFRNAVFAHSPQPGKTPSTCEKPAQDDGEMPPEAITLKNALLLEELTPWGKGCEEPLFYSDLTLVENRVMGVNHQRLQFVVEDANGQRPIAGVAFYLSEDEMPATLPARVKVHYHLGANRYRGSLTLQLLVKRLALLEDATGNDENQVKSTDAPLAMEE